MPIKIVDNKKIEMTEDEWDYYKGICRSYDRVNFKGEELFRELFETDDNGIIVFIRPPAKATSMEVYLFICSMFEHQHIRLIHKQVDDLCKELKEKYGSKNV